MSKGIIPIIISICSVFFACSCSKENVGDKMVGTWAAIFWQEAYINNGKVVFEYGADEYDPYHPVDDQPKYAIENNGDGLYSFTPYYWWASQSAWIVEYEDCFTIKRVKGNTYTYEDLDDCSVEISFSDHDTMTFFYVEDSEGIFYKGSRVSGPFNQARIDEYVNKGGIYFNGETWKMVLKRMN